MSHLKHDERVRELHSRSVEQTDRQTDAGIQTDRQRQSGRQTDGQTDRQRHRDRDRDKDKERQKERRNRQADRHQTGRQAGRDRDRGQTSQLDYSCLKYSQQYADRPASSQSTNQRMPHNYMQSWDTRTVHRPVYTHDIVPGRGNSLPWPAQRGCPGRGGQRWLAATCRDRH